MSRSRRQTRQFGFGFAWLPVIAAFEGNNVFGGPRQIVCGTQVLDARGEREDDGRVVLAPGLLKPLLRLAMTNALLAITRSA